MFKLRKRKPIDIVIRVQDLQIGDVLRIDLQHLGTVADVCQRRNHVWIKLENIVPVVDGNPEATKTMELYNDLKVIVYR